MIRTVRVNDPGPDHLQETHLKSGFLRFVIHAFLRGNIRRQNSRQAVFFCKNVLQKIRSMAFLLVNRVALSLLPEEVEVSL